MVFQMQLLGRTYKLLSPPNDISIAVDFSGAQPSMFGVPPATSAPYKGDGWVGDTREGSSCNFETITITPHCNGTHTECVGHITHRRVALPRVMSDVLVPAVLVTVEPQPLAGSGESYVPQPDAADRLILRSQLEAALSAQPREWLQAVVIRTLPNGGDKRTRNHSEHTPTFLSNDAMQYLHDLGVQHLLLDLPSVDRMHDEGKLTNHHIWWDIPQGSFEYDPEHVSYRTITEMVYVPNRLRDGRYVLNLQFAPFLGDAAPSRPVLFELKEIQ
jgi:kynurenine formamidase